MWGRSSCLLMELQQHLLQSKKEPDRHLKLLQLGSDQTLGLGKRSVTPIDALMDLRHGVWAPAATVRAATEHATLQRWHTTRWETRNGIARASATHSERLLYLHFPDMVPLQALDHLLHLVLHASLMCLRHPCSLSQSLLKSVELTGPGAPGQNLHSSHETCGFTLLKVRSPPFKHGPRRGLHHFRSTSVVSRRRKTTSCLCNLASLWISRVHETYILFQWHSISLWLINRIKLEIYVNQKETCFIHIEANFRWRWRDVSK